MLKLKLILFFVLLGNFLFAQLISPQTKFDRKKQNQLDKIYSYNDTLGLSKDKADEFWSAHLLLVKHILTYLQSKKFQVYTPIVLYHVAYFSANGKLDYFIYNTQSMISMHWPEDKQNEFETLLKQCLKNYVSHVKSSKPYCSPLPFVISIPNK